MDSASRTAPTVARRPPSRSAGRTASRANRTVARPHRASTTTRNQPPGADSAYMSLMPGAGLPVLVPDAVPERVVVVTLPGGRDQPADDERHLRGEADPAPEPHPVP